MADPLPELPPGQALLLRPKTADAIRQGLIENGIELDPTQFDKITRDGVAYYRLKPQGAGSDRAPLSSKGRGIPYLDGDKIRVSPVTITYKILPAFSTIEEPPGSGHFVSNVDPQYLEPIFPKIGGVPVNSPDAYFAASVGNHRLWLECMTHIIDESSGHENMLLTGGGSPTGAKGLTYVPYATFTIQTAGVGLEMVDVESTFASDWVQDYRYDAGDPGAGGGE